MSSSPLHSSSHQYCRDPPLHAAQRARDAPQHGSLLHRPTHPSIDSSHFPHFPSPSNLRCLHSISSPLVSPTPPPSSHHSHAHDSPPRALAGHILLHLPVHRRGLFFGRISLLLRPLPFLTHTQRAAHRRAGPAAAASVSGSLPAAFLPRLLLLALLPRQDGP